MSISYLSRACTSESYAYKCWYNYTYCNNTMQIPEEDFNKITQTWSNKLSDWKAIAEKDDNKYEIDDDDLNISKVKGADKAKEKTEFDGKADKNTSDSVIAGTAGAVGIAAGIVVGLTSTLNSLSGFMVDPYYAAAIGAILLVYAIKLKAADPNKEASDACETLINEELPEAQEELAYVQDDMEEYNQNIQDLSDQAQDTNENTNDALAKQQANYEVYQRTYEGLLAKMESGEALDDEEKELLKQLIPIMIQLGYDSSSLQDCSNEEVRAIYSEIGEYSELYDDAAMQIAEVQGLTEFAAQFDEATKKNASQVKTASTLAIAGSAGIVASGIQGAATSFLDIGRYVASGIAIATGTASGILFKNIANDQGKYESTAAMEIDMRENTEDLTEQTFAEYDENIDYYDAYMTQVENLELEVPEDLPASEDEAEEMSETLQKDADNAMAKTSAQGGNGQVGTFGIVQGSGNNTAGSSSNPNNDPQKDKDELF